MIKTKIIGVLAIALLSCEREKQSCSTNEFKDLNIYPASTVVKIPSYIITDTVKYGDSNNIFDYKVKAVDSSLIVYAGVTSYEQNRDAMPDFEYRIKSEKKSIQFWSDSIQLITDTIRVTNGVKVGYLKYFDSRADKKRYEGRIIFFRDKRIVNISLFENYFSNNKNKLSVMDCVLENIQIK